ncbi:MAG TPA: hypothetical protein VM925_32365 [Labilithrix sp.]|nr:hypothetical protein [Labilithrix sp.]
MTRADLVRPPVNEGGAPASSARGHSSMRPPLPSADDEEMTTLLDRTATTGISRPLPAAGRPASVPPPARSQSGSVRPPPVSFRPPPPSLRPPAPSVRPRPSSGVMTDDPGTATRGRLRKIVKASSSRSLGPQAGPASLSPDAVLKATLDSAFASRRDQLMPGPPSDLLEDSADVRNGAPSTSRSAPLRARGPEVFSVPVEASKSQRPPPVLNSVLLADGPSRSAPPAPSSRSRGFGASASVPGVVMSASAPAHFMRPQAPYSDPPGTTVTSGHRVGRPARSWAVALLACGVFVAIAAVAMSRAGRAAVDTTAAFVDPSRPTTKAAGQVAPPPPAPVDHASAAPSEPNGLPPGFLGASPMPPAPPPEPPVAVAPVVTTPAPTFAPVTVAPAPKPAAPSRPAVAWKPPPAPPAPPPKAAPKPAAPVSPAAAAAAEDEPVAKKGAATKKSAKGGGGGDTDDETKKALEALQKAQLESASSFGEK